MALTNGKPCCQKVTETFIPQNAVTLMRRLIATIYRIEIPGIVLFSICFSKFPIPSLLTN